VHNISAASTGPRSDRKPTPCDAVAAVAIGVLSIRGRRVTGHGDR
jgi:hypothetical protein